MSGQSEEQSAQPANRIWTPWAHQRNAIKWRFAGGPMVARFLDVYRLGSYCTSIRIYLTL